MTDFERYKSEGCEDCRRGVYSETWPPPPRISESSDGPVFLHRCDKCGAYWEFTLRFAHVIDETEARHTFPDAFRLGH